MSRDLAKRRHADAHPDGHKQAKQNKTKTVEWNSFMGQNNNLRLHSKQKNVWKNSLIAMYSLRT